MKNEDISKLHFVPREGREIVRIKDTFTIVSLYFERKRVNARIFVFVDWDTLSQPACGSRGKVKFDFRIGLREHIETLRKIRGSRNILIHRNYIDECLPIKLAVQIFGSAIEYINATLPRMTIDKPIGESAILPGRMPLASNQFTPPYPRSIVTD